MRVALSLGSVLLMSACSTPVSVTEGLAAPVTAAPSLSASVAAPSKAAPSLSSSPSTTPPTAPSTAPSNRPARPSSRATTTPRVLGPTGFGAVRLLMSERQATATGLVGSFRAAGPCRYAGYLASPDDGVSASSRGVMMIDGYGSYRTPEGINPGDAWSAARRAYPEISAPLGGNLDARNGIGEVAAPGNAAAIYRITWAENKVTKIQLWHRDNTCYQ